MKKLVLALLFFASAVNAQEFELGKVSIAELEQKAHSTEPDAEAAVLYEKGKTYMEYSENDGFVLVSDTEIRIKIYKKEGYNWANKEIAYYIANNAKEKVEYSKAITYNLVNGKIEKTKLKSEGEFDEKLNKFYNIKKIAMPAIKEGSVIEYKTTVRTPYMSSFPAWKFQKTIPVNSSYFQTSIPEYYTFNASFRGYMFPKKQQSKKSQSYTYSTKDRVASGGRFSTIQTVNGTGKFEWTENVTTYTAENMPSMKSEDYVNNINNYTSTVEHELTMTEFPNQPRKMLSVSWTDMVKTIYDNDDFGPELKKTGYFENEVKALTDGINDPIEKAAAVFNFVKSKMNWNGYYGYGCDDGVKTAYKNKVGNAAEINLMLTAMLRYCGINANPVLVSTRNNGIAIFPNRTAYNYVISAIELDNNVILLDATHKYSLPNILPTQVLNWEGRLIRENGSSTSVNLMPKMNSKDIVTIIATVDNQGKISGKARDQYFDYNAFAYRNAFNNVSKESYLEKLEKHYAGIEVEDYAVANDKDLSKPIVETYSFTHNNLGEVVGDKIYFSPLMHFTKTTNPFKQEIREYPIDFTFPTQDKYAFTITIPDGYAVESLPSPAALAMEDNLGNFKFNITTAGKQIQIVASMDINQAMVSQQYYETLKDFYKKVIEKHNEKIVLKKV